MTDEAKPVDIGKMLDERAERMVDKIEESGDPKSIASTFRTLVEFSRSKPPQKIEMDNLSVNITPVAGGKK